MPNSYNIVPPAAAEKSGSVGLSKSVSIFDGFNYPLFCFKYLNKKYDFEECIKADKRFLKALVNRIRMLSELKWSDIQFSDRQGTGSEKIHKSSIKPSLPNFITKDVNHLISFYFSGNKGRMVGHRNGPIFHVIFIDTDLSVYEHA